MWYGLLFLNKKIKLSWFLVDKWRFYLYDEGKTRREITPYTYRDTSGHVIRRFCTPLGDPFGVFFCLDHGGYPDGGPQRVGFIPIPITLKGKIAGDIAYRYRYPPSGPCHPDRGSHLAKPEESPPLTTCRKDPAGKSRHYIASMRVFFCPA
jgi:hypothetical protein